MKELIVEKFVEKMLFRILIADIEQETENFKTICNQTIQKMISTQRCKVKCFEEYQAALEKKEYAKARLLVYSKETVDIENQLKTSEDEYKTAKVCDHQIICNKK